MEILHTFLPIDRLQALAGGNQLPDYADGSVLFADVPGFTPLTESLAQVFGPQRGAEELTNQLNRVYTALIGPVRRFLAGDPAIQRMDVLTGSTLETLDRVGHLVERGMVVMEAAAAWKISLPTGNWRRCVSITSPVKHIRENQAWIKR